MEILSLEEIIKATEGILYIDGKIYDYVNISTDTRKLEKGSIFIALKGDNFNGNEFVVEAAKQGSVMCIVDEVKFNREDLTEGVTIIKVDDAKKALRNLAKYYRSKLDIKIIGVTGSTGKTSTKDLLAAALSERYKVFKTKGNFNNDIGLPLMIFKLDNSYDVAVLEMGMSNLNEIHILADIARPDIAIITNVGISHIENLKTRENILKAKMEITDFFGRENVLIINGDNDLLNTVEAAEYKLVRVGLEEEFDLKAENIILEEDSVEFQVKEQGKIESYLFSIPVPGKHNVLNSLLALACGRVLGMKYEELGSGIKNLQVTSMRLDIVRTEDYVIIDDSYNASPDSMKAAIDVQIHLKGNRKIAVLGTMRELGDKAYDAHVEVGNYAKTRGVDKLITVGEYNHAYEQGFSCDKNYRGFENCSEAADYVLSIIGKDDVVLVKASRAMKFESIVNKLKK